MSPPHFIARSLQARMTIQLAAVIAIVMLVTTWLTITRVTEAQRASVEGQLSESAQTHAGDFEAEARDAAATGRGLASTFSRYRQGDRKEASAIVKEALDRNPRVVGAYAGFDAGAFGGADADHKGKPYSMKDGRFGPYWNKLTGEVTLEALVDADVSDYYTLPKKLNRDVVIEPYLYEGVLMTSYVSPVVRDGKPVGIGGVDVTLSKIHEEVSKLKVLDSGYVLLVSNSGIFVSAQDEKLIGKTTLADYAKKHDNAQLAKVASDIAAGRGGKVSTTDPATGKKVRVFYAPVQTGKWGYVMVAPEAEMMASVNDLRNTLLIMSLIAVLLVAGAVAWLARRITAPVRDFVEHLRTLSDGDVAELNKGMHALSQGDMTVAAHAHTEPVQQSRRDEIGVAANTLNELIGSTHASLDAYEATRGALADMIGQVALTATDVSSSSQQMAATAEQTGSAVGEIATAINEVALGGSRQAEAIMSAQRSTEDITASTAESADRAQATAVAAREARAIAEEGEQAVTEITEAMAAVRKSSEEVMGAMRDLGEKNSQISGIVETITSIADQTNLLALNAAIEAARAGEQGRGFAVVAEEVRKLAEESSHAADQISRLTEEIQSETGKTTEVVEQSGRLSAEGAVTVEKARSQFALIGQSFEDVTGRIGEIAIAVEHIAESAQKMRDDMTEVSTVANQSMESAEHVSASTEQTSAATQEVSAGAQQLAHTADQLEELVGRFTLKV